MRKDITALEMRPADGVLKVGTAVQLNLFAMNRRGGTDLIPGNQATWSSADDQVAEVNRQGRLTPRHPGRVTVTAAYTDKTIAAVFTVVD